MIPPEHREPAFLEDETSAEEGVMNLQLVYDGYTGWLERLRNPGLKQSFMSWCSTTVPFYQDVFGGRECHELCAFPIVGGPRRCRECRPSSSFRIRRESRGRR